MKVLNNYCGIGGNRKLWPIKNDLYQITAVELSLDIAAIYQDFYPNDTVIVGDAHQYLLEHFSEFDFIWCSPPCQTHSRLNSFRKAHRIEVGSIQYPDMRLYQEIIILQHYFRGKWVIENVVPFYPPLINPQKILDRHYFWCNFFIEDVVIKSNFYMEKNCAGDLAKSHGINLDKYKFKSHKEKRQALRNCVNPELGKHIFDCAMEARAQSQQGELFLKL